MEKFSIRVNGKGKLCYMKMDDGKWHESYNPKLYGSGGKTYGGYLTPVDILQWIRGDYGDANIVKRKNS
jgi:hypothetical protein